MKKTKLFLFILSIFILGITVVQAASVTTVLEVGIKSPTASISASPTSVAYGTASNLTWSSKNATSCTVSSNAWSKAKAEATSGTASTGNLYQDSTFSISCTGPGGTSPTVSVSVTIKKPTGTLTSSSNSCTITLGHSTCPVKLTWRTYNPIGKSAITASKMSNYNANSGTNVSFVVPYSSRLFFLYNNGSKLAQTPTIYSSCVANTHWNGSSCIINTNTVSTAISTSAGSGGKISPTSRVVNYGSRTTFTVTPNTGSSIGTVSGCNGSLSRTTYTTGPITKACRVTATFTINSYTVSTSAGTGGTISPTSRVVNYGSRTTFTVSPKTGYHTTGATGCNGKLSGTTYTTGTITKACTVTASAHYMTGTLTSSSNSCVITLGHSTCPVNLTWRTYYPIGVSAITASTNITAKKANSGTGTFYPRSVAVSLLG